MALSGLLIVLCVPRLQCSANCGAIFKDHLTSMQHASHSRPRDDIYLARARAFHSLTITFKLSNNHECGEKIETFCSRCTVFRKFPTSGTNPDRPGHMEDYNHHQTRVPRCQEYLTRPAPTALARVVFAVMPGVNPPQMSINDNTRPSTGYRLLGPRSRCGYYSLILILSTCFTLS